MSPLRSRAGPGGLHERDVELGGDDLGQRGLAQPRRTGQQHVVQRLPAAGGGLDRDRELIADRLLADEVLQPAGPQRALELELVAGQLLGVLDARSTAPRSLAGALRRAWAMSSSVLSPEAPSSSPSISLAL